MKRLREEVYSGPPFKRPLSSTFPRTDSNGTSQAPTASGNGVSGNGNTGAGGDVPGSTQKLTTNDALSYLKQVKDMFQDQRGKYDCFLDVMKDFKGQRIDTAGVIHRVKELFKGHPNLILGFNTFLPKGYEVSLTDDEQAPPKRTVEFEEAISFVNKIKKRFQNDDHIYKSFLDILNMYRKEHKNITEVYREVATLFRGHTDLLDEFTKFLPDSSASTAHFSGSFNRHFFNRSDERNSSLSAIRQTYADKRKPKERPIDAERYFSVERPDTEEDKTAIKMHREQKKHAERENRDKRSSDMNDQDLDNENNLEVNTHRVSEKRKSAKKYDDFGSTANFASFENKDALKSVYNQEFLFCEKVKERLHNADDYQDFLKCLHLYSQEIISRLELQDLVAAIIGKHQDLLECFHEFLERCERMDGFLPGVMGKKSSLNEANTSKLLKIEDKEKEHRREGEGGKEKERPNSKYFGKPIQELDLSNSECCTPSYRLLPDDYPISTVSQRSELGNQVLNDKWVSVTSGSEDYSFKHMRRNQYEESLFRCEDDRFELDMLLESVSSTSKQAEELLNGITDNSVGTDGPIRIEDHFTALNLRCIERLYGDHGLDVMDILRKNPSLALPVILTRLKQKQEEWIKCRADFNKVWAEIYHKNHHKTLDHRSFYFKQQDSKNLSTKSLVADIKEIKEKMQKEDDAVLSLAAGSRHSCNPHMEFEYTDADVQEDVFRIIKYSCEEICSSKDQLQKVLRFWTHFIEPILGVRSRSYGMDTTGDRAIKHKALKSGENEGEPVSDAAVTPSKEIRSYNGDAATSSQLTNFTSRMASVVGGMKEGQDMLSTERNDVPATSRPNANHVSAANTVHVRNGSIDGADNAKYDVDDRLSSEHGWEMLKLNQSTNFEFGEVSRPIRFKEDSVDPGIVEKEEGELSPNGDFEDNFASSQECSLQAVPEENGINVKIEAQMGINEDICVTRDKNDVDADDEDSENISVDGDDVSGSESASDDCSREEHEEEEDVEHDDIDVKAESEGETEIACGTHYNGGDGASLPLSEQHLLACKPIFKLVSSPLVGDLMKERQVLYGNDTLYVLFRLHQTLYERISFAKMRSVSSDSRSKMTKDATCDLNSRFINALFSLLDGTSDNTKFEDDCRSLIGNQAYVLFTLDKLIYKLVKQLQIVSSDEVCCKLLQLFDYEKSRKPQKYADSVHYENVHVLLHDENVYQIECTYNPTRLSIQLMDDGKDKSEVVAVSIDPNFATYLQYDYLSVNHGRMELSALMRKRNTQKYNNLDESSALFKATESTRTLNGLECKMASSTSKISYVLDTADYFIRLGRKKIQPIDQHSQARKAAATQRFHKLLESSNLH